MRGSRLLREAISKKPDTVLDIASGPGNHAICFIANGSTVAGIDLTPAGIEHGRYQHIQMPTFRCRMRMLTLKIQSLIWCGVVIP